MLNVGILGDCGFTNMALHRLIIDINTGDSKPLKIPTIYDYNTPIKQIDILIIHGALDLASFHKIKSVILIQKINIKKIILMTDEFPSTLWRLFFITEGYNVHHIKPTSYCQYIIEKINSLLSCDKNIDVKNILTSSKLTRRELEILHALYSGERPNQICNRLSISAKTVSARKRSALRKINFFCHNPLLRNDILIAIFCSMDIE